MGAKEQSYIVGLILTASVLAVSACVSMRSHEEVGQSKVEDDDTYAAAAATPAGPALAKEPKKLVSSQGAVAAAKATPSAPSVSMAKAVAPLLAPKVQKQEATAAAKPKTLPPALVAAPTLSPEPLSHRQKAASRKAGGLKAPADTGTTVASLDLEKSVRYVAANLLNVHSAPRVDAPVVAKLTRGSMFPVILNGEWAKLGDGQFVLIKFLQREDPAPLSPKVAMGR